MCLDRRIIRLVPKHNISLKNPLLLLGRTVCTRELRTNFANIYFYGCIEYYNGIMVNYNACRQYIYLSVSVVHAAVCCWNKIT